MPLGLHRKAQWEPSEDSVSETAIPAGETLFQTTGSALAVRGRVQTPGS